MHHRDMSDPGAHWLADGHPDPDQVWDEWADDRSTALLPAGVRWDAVVMPHLRMQSVTEDLGPQVLDHCPVLVDLATRRAYVLVPPGTAKEWAETHLGDGVSVIGHGSWLVASRPRGRQSPIGTWQVAPGSRRRLADPATLLDSLRRTAQ